MAGKLENSDLTPFVNHPSVPQQMSSVGLQMTFSFSALRHRKPLEKYMYSRQPFYIKGKKVGQVLTRKEVRPKDGARAPEGNPANAKSKSQIR